MRKPVPAIYGLCLLMLAGFAVAQDDKPRWMSPEAGWVDEESGARVESVSEDKENGGYRVELSVPRVEKPIEEVLVVGQREEGPSLNLPHMRFEVINDLDADRSGIIFYIGEKEDFAVHINYHDGSKQTLPKRNLAAGLTDD